MIIKLKYPIEIKSVIPGMNKIVTEIELKDRLKVSDLIRANVTMSMNEMEQSLKILEVMNMSGLKVKDLMELDQVDMAKIGAHIEKATR